MLRGPGVPGVRRVGGPLTPGDASLMQTPWHAAHLLLAWLWLGGLLAALIAERALRRAGPPSHLRRAELRWRLGAWLELPASLGMLLSGALLLSQPHEVGRGFIVMVVAGLMAIFFNIFSAWLIHKRRAAARGGRWASFDKLDALLRRLGLLVLLATAAALFAGAWAPHAG
jgi:hypothetical protein